MVICLLVGLEALPQLQGSQIRVLAKGVPFYISVTGRGNQAVRRR